MKGSLFVIFLVGLLCPGLLPAQEYSYKQYDVKDGLASSTIYCITQDKGGFIWLGTEAGVCRFDGTHFKTFNIADGLPDVEIVQMLADYKGRVWMAPFRGSVCYYYRGSFHNQGNDSVLSRLQLKGNIEDFAEDAAGNILIQEPTGLQLVGADGHVRNYDSAGGEPIEGSTGCGPSRDGHFIVQIGEKIFELTDSGFSQVGHIRYDYFNVNYFAISPSWLVYRSDSVTVKAQSLPSGRTTVFPFFYSGIHTVHVSYSIVRDSLLFFNRMSGTLEYNLSRGAAQGLFLPGRRVSRTFMDAAGNIWFTTLGDGIYRLNSPEFKIIHLPPGGEFGNPSITCITLNKSRDTLLLGDNQNAIIQLTYPGLRIASAKPTDYYAQNAITFIRQVGDNQYVFGSNDRTSVGEIHSIKHHQIALGMKSAYMMDDHRILMGGPWGAIIMDLRAKKKTDTLWRSRISAVYSRNDTNYIGTLHGLWRLTGKAPPHFMGPEAAIFRERIAALVEGEDGILWVATYDTRLIGYRAGKIIAELGAPNGLVGNICHTIFLHDGILWMGTDKGLNRVDLERPGFPVTFFDSNDGLASDVVNTIFAADSTIFVGTPSGLSCFDESKATTGDECRLKLTGLVSAGHNRIGDTAGLVLPPNANNIRFEFVAISYRSAGKISYRYRLTGLDSTWRETNDNFLAYPTLPYGRYMLQLQAVNRFGNRSEIRDVPFVAESPVWQETWFYSIVLVVFLLVIWAFIAWRIRRIRRQQELKAMQTRRMAELEHIALQSQMNPHFIFNCLNSIQQFVFEKDMLATNEFITGFARLIRATLNHSSRAFISVAEEVEYLADYLSLEKMRFKSKMDYLIEVAKDVDARNNRLPPLLLQPYVENSVRHGIRHKTTGQGQIHIQFQRDADQLLVVISDNGIGRQAAMGYKTGEHIEYQSKGMSLTSSRIQIIRILYKCEIEVAVEDLRDDQGVATGTRITLRFPDFGLDEASPPA